MAQEPDVKPEAKAQEATQPQVDIEALKRKVDQLEQAIGQLVGIVQAQQKLIQSIQQAPPPQAQAPQPQPQPQNPLNDPQRMAQLITVMAPLLQLMQPKGSELEKLIISKALDGLISMYDLNKGFMQSLMEALASSFGKKAGERLGTVVVSEE
jgi:small-conductance mechanosensitive channel